MLRVGGERGKVEERKEEQVEKQRGLVLELSGYHHEKVKKNNKKSETELLILPNRLFHDGEVLTVSFSCF